MILVGASLAALTLFLAPASAAPVPSDSKSFPGTLVNSPQRVVDIEEATKNLTPEDRAKVLSGEPIIITVNAHTGMVESIEPLP
ncbi:hypothetical protein CVS30_17145 [Arthrobacter psychrolactophilus]|uniref:Uncharacterized protein n=2 Tax=Arthrobacter psychrolactophilus TaxID=92442 RepID=A0A2V5INY9_9MICC|nr:hypothetical protein CVS30_17145 [Arthrobacter psychrolactophilus]